MRRRVDRCFLSCRGYALRRSLIRLSLCCAVGSAGVRCACGACFQCIGVVGRGWEPLFLLSHAGIFCGFVCGGVCLSEYDTPKTAIFSDLNYFFIDYLFN